MLGMFLHLLCLCFSHCVVRVIGVPVWVLRAFHELIHGQSCGQCLGHRKDSGELLVACSWMVHLVQELNHYSYIYIFICLIHLNGFMVWLFLKQGTFFFFLLLDESLQVERTAVFVLESMLNYLDLFKKF